LCQRRPINQLHVEPVDKDKSKSAGDPLTNNEHILFKAATNKHTQ